MLAKYASCAGNFAEVTEQIIEKIPQRNEKLTYSHGNYLFHYVTEDGIIYMCITDDVSTKPTFFTIKIFFIRFINIYHLFL